MVTNNWRSSWPVNLFHFSVYILLLCLFPFLRTLCRVVHTRLLCELSSLVRVKAVCIERLLCATASAFARVISDLFGSNHNFYAHTAALVHLTLTNR